MLRVSKEWTSTLNARHRCLSSARTNAWPRVGTVTNSEASRTAGNREVQVEADTAADAAVASMETEAMDSRVMAADAAAATVMVPEAATIEDQDKAGHAIAERIRCL